MDFRITGGATEAFLLETDAVAFAESLSREEAGPLAGTCIYVREGQMAAVALGQNVPKRGKAPVKAKNGRDGKAGSLAMACRGSKAVSEKAANVLAGRIAVAFYYIKANCHVGLQEVVSENCFGRPICCVATYVCVRSLAHRVRNKRHA